MNRSVARGPASGAMARRKGHERACKNCGSTLPRSMHVGVEAPYRAEKVTSLFPCMFCDAIPEILPQCREQSTNSGFSLTSSWFLQDTRARVVTSAATSISGSQNLMSSKDGDLSTRVGVLLLNLGGPDTLDDVEPFLFNLFADPEIIRLPKVNSFEDTRHFIPTSILLAE